MILGIRASVYTPTTYLDGLSLFRDNLQLFLAREYKAGTRERTAHGSPSWAEIPGLDGGLGMVIAAQGVFGPDLLTGPAFILESDNPAADAVELAERGFQQIGDVIHDAWWRDIAIVRGPDNVTLILCEFTGRLGQDFDQEYRKYDLSAT
jgi:hypothetical protein